MTFRTAAFAAAGLSLAALPALAASDFVPGTEPLSTTATNITPSDTHSEISPRLPAPPLGADASPASLLRHARTALQSNRTGEAQQALEMAETRMLDRSVPQGGTETPDQSPALHHVSSALLDLGQGHVDSARMSVDAAIGVLADPTNT